jgi:Domain of unknown function (DUF4157)
MKTASQTEAQAQTRSFIPVQAGLLQRKGACGGSAGPAAECEKCSEQHLSLRRKAQDSERENRNSAGLPSLVHEVLRLPGQPLDPATRAFMEPRFGHDFSGVRIHADGSAAESARVVNAKAYTVGREIVFAAGQFQPGTRAGQQLLAHELTHVAQQAPGQSSPAGVSSPSDHAEHEAEFVAAAIMTGGAVSVKPHAGAALVQRQDDFRLPPLPSFQLKTPGLRPPARRLSLLPPGAQLQTSDELKRKILSMTGITNVRPLSTQLPRLPRPAIPPPNRLIRPGSAETPESEPDEDEKVWDVEFEADVEPDSEVQRQKDNMDKAETITGQEAEDAPIGLKLGSTGLNLLGSIPGVREERERFHRALRIDSLTIIANPVPGQQTLGLIVRFRF